METAGSCWIPPAPPVPRRDMPLWRLLWELRSSNISIWPERAYDEMLLPRKVFGLRTILVNDPAGIRQVLSTNAAHYRRYMVTSRLLRPVAGDGVLLAEGEEWRRQRRIASPAFTPANIELVLPQFVEAGHELCRNAEAMAARGEVNLYRVFQTAAIDGLGRGLFSLSFAERARHLGEMARDYFKGPGRPNVGDSFARREEQFAWMTRGRAAFRKRWFGEIASIVEEWSASHDAEGARSGSARNVMTLLRTWRDPATGDAISERELRHQAATMIAAGFETTALVMFWTAYLLANDQARQDRIREQLAVAPPGEVSTMNDLGRWANLREAIHEAMRLYPPVAFMSRMAVEPTEIAGMEIPIGTVIVISPWVLHRHRAFWKEPHLFRPERFRDSPRAHLAGGPYIPFGSGPRTCIGASFAMAEATILLASLFARYTISVNEARKMVPQAIISTTPSVEPSFRLSDAPIE